MNESTTENRSDFVQHSVALSGALLVIVVATKALRVAHMDLTTAQVLLVNGSTAGIISGVLLLIYPGLASVFFLTVTQALLARWVIGVVTDRPRPSRGILSYRFLIPATLASALVCYLAVPASTLWGFASGPLIALALVVITASAALVLNKIRPYIRLRQRVTLASWRRNRRPLPRRATHAHTLASISWVVYVGIAGFFTALPLAAAVFNDVSWLPPETVKVAGRPPITAYEVSRNDDRVLLLVESTREILAVPPSDISSQKPCRLTNIINSQPSLHDLIINTPSPSTTPCS